MKRFLLTSVAALALTSCASGDVNSPAPGGALFRVAERLAAGGDAATAAAIYRSALALGKKTPDVRRGLGNALLTLGEPRAAIEQFEAGLAQSKDARLYNGLGVAHDMMGEHARAQDMFRAGLALEPDYRALIHNYGLSLAAADAATTAVEEPVAPKAAAPEPPAAPRATAAKAAPEPEIDPAPAPKPVAAALDMPVASPATPVPEVAPVQVAVSFTPAPRVNEIVPLGRPVAAVPMHGSYYRFRLAGYATREGAMESWRALVRRAPELKGAIEVVARRASLGRGAGTRYALVSAPLPNLRLAEAACDTLNERGLACRTEPASSALTVPL